MSETVGIAAGNILIVAYIMGGMFWAVCTLIAALANAGEGASPFVALFAATPLWPLAALAFYVHTRETREMLPWTPESKLARRIIRAEREQEQISLRIKAEAEEAKSRLLLDQYLEASE